MKKDRMYLQTNKTKQKEQNLGPKLLDYSLKKSSERRTTIAYKEVASISLN